MRGFILTLLFAATAANATYDPLRPWKEGDELEVDAGVYAKLLFENSGWRLWRFETKAEQSCLLVKSVDGARPAAPVGIGKAIYNGTPRLHITAPRGKEIWSIDGVQRAPEVKYRVRGEKFFQEPNGSQIPDFEEGTQLDLSVTTWRYPEYRVGMKQESGVLNLHGLKQARAQLDQCVLNLTNPSIF